MAADQARYRENKVAGDLSKNTRTRQYTDYPEQVNVAEYVGKTREVYMRVVEVYLHHLEGTMPPCMPCKVAAALIR